MFNIGTEYKSAWLRTHAAIIGMTGSGKTGLGIVMMEEAAKQGIPAIIIDPKGDLTNLLDKQVGMNYKIYTPGDQSGIPVNIMANLQTCDTKEKINSTVTAILGLAGVDADPLGKEHILISNILERQKVDIAALINAIQSPPFNRLGVMPLEQFYPEKKRYELAIRLNNFMAAPAFKDWLAGEPINFEQEHSIYYLAHLNDEERMFFLTLLYTEIESWMRTQSGSDKLERLIYFDEVAEYLPPVKNTPVKPVILRLLKQARAYGLGLILATQNPVDLDYKALSNIGTWMIGKLQTEQDKARIIEGLEEDINLSGLDHRKFLLHSIYQDDKIFRVRNAINKLTGPMTKDELPEQEWFSYETDSIKVIPAVPSRYDVYYHGNGKYEGFIGGRAKVTFAKKDVYQEKTISVIYDNGWKLFDIIECEAKDNEYKPLDIPYLKESNLVDWIYRTQFVKTLYNKSLKMTGTEADFKKVAKDEHNRERKEAHTKYLNKLNTLRARLDREKHKLSEYEAKLGSRKAEEAASGLETTLSIISGRRRSLSAPLRKHRMVQDAKARIESQKVKIQSLLEQWQNLNDQLNHSYELIAEKWNNKAQDFTVEKITPYKKDVIIELFGVIWIGGLHDSEPKGDTR